MEKSRASVKLCEASVGVDRSDVTVTFRLNLWPQEQTEAKRDTTRWEKVNIIKYGCNRQDCKGNKTLKGGDTTLPRRLEHQKYTWKDFKNNKLNKLPSAQITTNMIKDTHTHKPVIWAVWPGFAVCWRRRSL